MNISMLVEGHIFTFADTGNHTMDGQQNSIPVNLSETKSGTKPLKKWDF